MEVVVGPQDVGTIRPSQELIDEELEVHKHLPKLYI
jgi:hypothetical protein